MKRAWFERALVALIVIACAVAFVKECRWLEQPVVDDAAITLAYARTFFAGGGARLTFASAPVEGFSDPLWMLLVGWAFPLHLDPLRWAQRLSTTFGVLTVVATALFGPAVHGRPPRLEDAAAPILLCCFPLFPYWATSGLETTLYAFLLTASVLVVIREERRRRGSWTGVCLSLAFLTRPEAPLVMAAALVYWVTARVARRKRPGKQELFILLWLTLLCGGYLLLRWSYFARVIPNTYFAKRWWDYAAADYLKTFCQHYTAIVCVAAVGALVVSTFGSVHERRVLALLLLVVAGGVLFIVVSRADWMNELRFCVPYSGVLAMIFAATLVVCRGDGGIWRNLATLVMVAGAFTAVYRDSKPHLVELKDLKNFAAESVRQTQGVSLDQLRVALGLEQGRFGIPDVGGSSLYLAHDEIVDVVGLADYAMAEHTLKRQAQEDYLLNEGLPDVLDTHGQSLYLNEFHELMKHYSSYRDGSSFALRDLTKDNDPRCPGSLAEVRDLSLADFEKRMRATLEDHDGGLGIALWRCGQQHRAGATMPSAETQRQLAERAERAARTETDNVKKLRMFSLATILSNENAHLRRTTERLRERLRARKELPGLTPRKE